MNEESLNIVKTLLDKEKIRELITAFAKLQEKQACVKESVRNVFTEEGSLEFPTGSKGAGVNGILNAIIEVNKSFISVLANVSNERIELLNDSEADICFHMNVLHKFAPEIAENLPGDLFVVYDNVKAKAVKQENEWRFISVNVISCYKVMTREAE